jgi:hypothetical protein
MKKLTPAQQHVMTIATNEGAVSHRTGISIHTITSLVSKGLLVWVSNNKWTPTTNQNDKIDNVKPTNLERAALVTAANLVDQIISEGEVTEAWYVEAYSTAAADFNVDPSQVAYLSSKMLRNASHNLTNDEARGMIDQLIGSGELTEEQWADIITSDYDDLDDDDMDQVVAIEEACVAALATMLEMLR